MEELNDDNFLFDRKNVFVKPMYHSSSMDEITNSKMAGNQTYKIKQGMNMTPLPKVGNNNNINNINSKNIDGKEDNNGVVPLLSEEEMKNINSLFDNMNVNEIPSNNKTLRHGKSYDNLTSKKYNRTTEPPPPLPSQSTSRINYVMKFDFPPPPLNNTNSPTINRAYATPPKNKGSPGYMDDFNFN